MNNQSIEVGVAPDAPPIPDSYDWSLIVDGLNEFLRLRSDPVGMKMFESVEQMENIPRIRRPEIQYALDQIVAQARWYRRTIGITMDDLIGAQCGAPVGLYPETEEWLSRTSMSGVWFNTDDDAVRHQRAMDRLPYGRYKALAVSPILSGRLNPPDIVLIYGTPGQMITLINGLQFSGYKKFDFSVVGESACADSWGRALKTGEPSLSIPCFADRRFGGVPGPTLRRAYTPRY